MFVWMKTSTGIPGVSLTWPSRAISLRRNGNSHRVVGCAASLILGHVTRHDTDLAVDLRGGSAVEVGKAHHCRLTDPQLVDVLRLHLGFDDQLVGCRHDQHDLLAR